MGYRALELVISSTKDLTNVNSTTTMKPYVEVSICDSQNKDLTPVQKSLHSERGSNPTWNFQVKLYIDVAKAKENSLALVVKLMSYRISHLKPNKEIGEVRVPIVELLDGFGEAEANAVAEKHVTKDALGSDGKTQGTLNFSYKVGRTEEYPPAGYASLEPSGTVGSFFKALGEEITAALISVGVSFGVSQAVDSALNRADDEEYPPAGYGSLEPSGTVGSFFKALGEEITAALISVGVSFGVSQAVDSALNRADDEGENASEAGFGQLVKEL
ncbi:protein SRC2 [Quercus suber]|uniref:protein SRC2 n=1 Tax=Quercus suber TaxID=58331 RepID=UPI0032E05783